MAKREISYGRGHPSNFPMDYDISHAFLDRRGSALRVLTTTVSDFWENIGEGAIPGSFLVEHKATDSYRQLSLEPTSINGSLEWSQGFNSRG